MVTVYKYVVYVVSLVTEQVTLLQGHVLRTFCFHGYSQ